MVCPTLAKKLATSRSSLKRTIVEVVVVDCVLALSVCMVVLLQSDAEP